MEQFGDCTCELPEVIEKFFGVEFADDELLAAETVGLLGDWIERKLADPSSGAGGSTTSEIFSKLGQVIAAEVGMKSEKITPETRFPEGLKIY